MWLPDLFSCCMLPNESGYAVCKQTKIISGEYTRFKYLHSNISSRRAWSLILGRYFEENFYG